MYAFFFFLRLQVARITKCLVQGYKSNGKMFLTVRYLMKGSYKYVQKGYEIQFIFSCKGKQIKQESEILCCNNFNLNINKTRFSNTLLTQN